MCKYPLVLDDRTVKCGQCKECLTQRAREWAWRTDEEIKRFSDKYFVTLTYRDKDVPLIEHVDEETGEIGKITTLRKQHFQRFLKKLRKAQSKISKQKLRMLYTGEYGGTTRRAHYHMILLGLHPSLTSFNPEIKSKKPQKDPKLAKIWGLGFCKTGRVEGGSIRYVTNYMMTKNIDCIGDEEKPFMQSSMGWGSVYIDTYQQRHWEQFSHKMVRPTTKRPNLPRYYMERIYDAESINKLNEVKSIEAEQYRNEKAEKAIKRDPLNPWGAQLSIEAEAEKAKERYQEFLNKMKPKI